MKTTITQNQIFETFSRLQRSCCSAVFLLLFLLSASSSWGQIAQRGSATSAISTTASVTINKPTGVVSGDIMIANIGNYIQATQTSATCSGWTLIAGTDVDRGRATLLYKIAGGSEPNTYTFAVTASSSASSGAIVAFSGVNTTTPFDVTASTSWFTAGSTSLSSIPSVSTVTANSAVLMFGNCSRVTTQTNANFLNANWTLTSPSLLTELYDVGHNNVGNTPCIGAAWALKPSTGATGNGGLNCNVNTNPRTLAGITIALRPCLVVNAGAALAAICQGGTSAGLGGTVGGSATGGTWSADVVGGTFSPNATTLNATYTPPSNFNGTVTLTLTTSGGSCGTATASKTLSVGISVAASTTTPNICSGSTAALTAEATGPSNGTIAFQGFESSGSTVTYAASGGATKSGTSGSGDRPASTSFVNSGSGSYWVTNGSATITTANITGLTNYSSKKVSLDLASFSVGSNGNGADGSDLVTVAISLDGGTNYSDELQVAGNSNACWSFTSGTGVATVTYDGDNTATSFAPSGGDARTTDGFSLLEINLPNSATQVRIRVTMVNNSNNEGWVIDDIALSGVNASFEWTSVPSGFTSNLQNVSVSPTVNTTYTATVTNIAGCSASSTVNVNVSQPNAATISYAGTPFCSTLTSGLVTRTGTTGGTYSSTAGLSINTNTGEINPSLSTAGTYTVTYTMAAGGGCAAQTATTSVTINAAASATINYTGSPFCRSVTAAQTVTRTGTAGGTYTSTAGLTINPSTGAITPSSSTAGTYTVTYTVTPGGCSTFTTTASVTITTLPAATISYAGTPFCSSDANAEPVTFSGTTGGTFSSTAGLSINSSTGEITPSTSTVGTYTVTYTMAAGGGCAAQTATTGIMITGPITLGAPSSSPTLRINSALTNITRTTTGATGISNSGVAGANGLPAGVSATWASNTITISGTPTAEGIFNYSIPVNGGCASVNATGTITVVTYKSEFVSANLGSPNWCAGETREISVTVKNIGSATWADNAIGTQNINIGVKWNTNGGNWTDYHVRTDAGGLAPGETGTFNFTLTAANNTGSSYTTNLAEGTNNITFDLVYEAISWFGNNGGGVGPGNTVFTSANQTIGVPAPTSPVSGAICGTGTVALAATAPAGSTIDWYAASSGGSVLTNGTGVTSFTTPSISSTTIFYAQSRNTTTGCVSTTRTAVTATVNAVPTITNASICAGGSGSLTVTSSCNNLPGQTSGPSDATSGTNVTGVGTVAWTNLGNIAGAGTAGMAVTASSATNYLQGTGYGFSIPSNAIINGITVTINRSTSGTTSPLLRDNQVSLVKGGAIQTTNKAVTGTNWPGTLTSATYGGTTDLWSSTWTAADINASNFGVVLSAINNNTGNPRTAAVDFMRITVTYTLPGELNWYTQSSGGSVISTGSTFNPVGVANSGLANTNTAGTTSYYVACSTAAGACRAKADFEIKPTPNNATGTNGYASIPACTTSTAVSVTISADAGLGNTIKWYNAAGTLLFDSLVRNSFYAVSVTADTAFYAESVSSSGGCASLSRIPVQAILINTNTWQGDDNINPADWHTSANWSCGNVPTVNNNVVIPSGLSNYPVITGANAVANKITSSGNLSLGTTSVSSSLTVTNEVVVNGGSFVVNSGSNLVQSNNVTNTGNITVKRNSNALNRLDYTLWSSPVLGRKLFAFSPETITTRFYMYDTPNRSYVNKDITSGSMPTLTSTNNFEVGRGYLIRTPNTWADANAPQVYQGEFTGVPNNGPVTVPLNNTNPNAENKYNLVGNPYPSAISATEFLTANAANIFGTIYLWRQTFSNQLTSAYCVLTSAGYTSNGDVNAISNPASLVDSDLKSIPAGQGFFVKAKGLSANESVVFTNDMRETSTQARFHRSMETEKHRIWINATSATGAFSQMLLGYMQDATNGVDSKFDGTSMGDGAIVLTSSLESKQYAIQARALPFDNQDVVPLSFKATTAGNYTFTLAQMDGMFAAGQDVYVKDKELEKIHNLKESAYTFSANAGTFANRFEIVFQATLTDLQANSCGATIANMNSLVYADLINGATGYRFKVVNNTTSAVQTIDRPQHWFAFNMLSAYDYSTPYTISVQVQKDGVWTGYYGATCTVNSPNIAATGVMQINPSQCGATLATLGTVIATTPVAGATGYKFRITNTTANASGTNMVQEITRSNHWFTLGMLSRYSYGSSYTVEVAVKTTGAFTPYGNACTVYSPSAPTLASCGQTVATATTLVRTTAMTLATQYRFQVTRMSTQETITFDTANFWFSFRVNVPGYAAGEQYGVRVAVMTAGAWSPYGDACDINAPIATARTTEEAAPSEANLFKPVAYPNPFANTFGISLATPSADVVHVMVYDLQGRLIEKQNVFVSQLDSLQIGTNYPSGDYLLVVAQGANIKSSHIHKD